MTPARPQPQSSVVTALVCAGAVSAQFIAAKATRDALYLAHLPVTSLPTIVVATSVISIVLVVLSARTFRSFSPAVVVPALFGLSALLLMASWGLTFVAPTLAAQLVYLEVSGLGPMLGSGFWLIATECFDPHTARLRFGQIAGTSTLSGLVGGLIAERVAATMGVEAMLPILAALNVLCMWQVRRLAAALESRPRHAIELTPELAPDSARSGLHVLANAPYLRNLAAIVVLGTTAAALVDYVFKAQAVNTFGRGDTLLRFFALYYTVTSLLSFVIQAASSRFALEKAGLAITTGTPSIALLLGGAGALLAPGLEGALVARAGESIFRGSLFRTAYELFYTPIPPKEKRAAKSIIDVGFDRLGDAVGGALIRGLLFLSIPLQYPAILLTSLLCAAATLVFASRLNRGYIQTLERSLLNRALELDLSDVEDLTTRTTMMRTMGNFRTAMGTDSAAYTRSGLLPVPFAAPAGPTGTADPEIQEVLTLRSRDRERIAAVLKNEHGLTAALVPHAITLLAWDPVAEEAVHALRKVAEEHVGQLIDALLDPNQPFAVRRRLARVFSVCVSQRAADGLLLGLDDMRFEVRFQCGRSLAAILEKNPRIKIDRDRAFDVIRREVAVSRPVWESHRLLDRPDEGPAASFADAVVKDRANQSLAHTFTLLSLVLPTEPLQIAYRGLHTDDQALRGTALEYLEGVLPPDIHNRLWPFLEERRGPRRPPRARDEILDELLRSNQSIAMNLEELKRRARAAHDGESPRVGAVAAPPADSKKTPWPRT